MALIPISLMTDIALRQNTNTGLVIRAIDRSVLSITNTLSYLSTSSQVYIDEVLTVVQKDDLEYTVKIIKALINGEHEKKHSPVIIQALEGVSEILNIIEKDLTSLKTAVEVHSKKYFKNWRGFYWDGSTDDIILYSKKLHHRYSILVDLLKIEK